MGERDVDIVLLVMIRSVDGFTGLITDLYFQSLHLLYLLLRSFLPNYTEITAFVSLYGECN